MESKDAIVVGGGISGLTAAWNLKKAGIDVGLVEKDETLGGCMRTEKRCGFLLEKGPFNVIVRDPAFEELLADLSEDVNVVSASRRARSRFLYRRGRLMSVPTNPFALAATGLLSLTGKCRAVRGVIASRRPSAADWTIADFAVRRFGREVSGTLVSAAVAGILAGDIHKLSLNACFPSLARFDCRARSPLAYGLSKAAAMMGSRKGNPRRRWRGLVSIDHGLGAICEALARRLGDDVLTGWNVDAVSFGSDGHTLFGRRRDGADLSLKCGQLVIALPCAAASRLLSTALPEAGEILNSIESASLAVINMAFTGQDVSHPMNGFGFLVPDSEPDFPLMGVLWADSAFPHHGRPGQRLVRVFIGGARTPNVMSRSNDELVATAMEALGKVLGVSGRPTLVDVCRYPAAIPQYHLGHVDRMDRLRVLAGSIPGLHLVGNYLEGVSINDCVRLSKRVAQEVVRGRTMSTPLPCAPSLV